VLFILRKGDSKLHIVVNYRMLNKDTIKNRYSLPLITEIRERIIKVNWFSSLNFPIGFNHIRVKEKDKYKMAFQTYNGYY